jgi:hypothetical protein
MLYISSSRVTLPGIDLLGFLLTYWVGSGNNAAHFPTEGLQPLE